MSHFTSWSFPLHSTAVHAARHNLEIHCDVNHISNTVNHIFIECIFYCERECFVIRCSAESSRSVPGTGATCGHGAEGASV
jgi:hypothetical protein